MCTSVSNDPRISEDWIYNTEVRIEGIAILEKKSHQLLEVLVIAVVEVLPPKSSHHIGGGRLVRWNYISSWHLPTYGRAAGHKFQ